VREWIGQVTITPHEWSHSAFRFELPHDGSQDVADFCAEPRLPAQGFGSMPTGSLTANRIRGLQPVDIRWFDRSCRERKIRFELLPYATLHSRGIQPQ
jgi:hypothetical protein